MARCGIAATKTYVHSRTAEKMSLEEAADNSPGREAWLYPTLDTVGLGWIVMPFASRMRPADA